MDLTNKTTRTDFILKLLTLVHRRMTNIFIILNKKLFKLMETIVYLY